jgi:hypothetical protein
VFFALLALALAASPDAGAARAPPRASPAAPDGGTSRGPTPARKAHTSPDAGALARDAGTSPGADRHAADSRDAGTADDAGVVSLDGGLTPEQLDRAALVVAAKERSGDVFACYAAALRDAPGLKGMIRMAWTVELDGTTSDVHVDETDIDDPGFHTCVTSSIRVWRFPRLLGGAPVKFAYRWTLNPKARR